MAPTVLKFFFYKMITALTLKYNLLSGGTIECSKGQHWLGLQELVACGLEPFNGLCLALGQ